MANDDRNRDDDDFVDRLANIEEALSDGHALAPTPQVTPELNARLKKGLQALQALRQLRSPRRLPPTIGVQVGDTWNTVAHGPIPRNLGRFQIQRELGRGGFGIVFLARDPKLHRDVALKVPHSSALLDDGLRERFRREAQAAAHLEHPHIVSVFETDEQGPFCWIAYAYCPGISLGEWLAHQTAAIPVQETAQLISTLADAVQHAHDRGVLHRDLKPANILLQISESRADIDLGETKGPSTPSALFHLHSAIAKVSDFGLAKKIDEVGDVTRPGSVLGTPAYMSPEQASGRRDLDQSTDIYALGTILYEMLTGRPPFRGESDLDTLQLVQNTEPVPPRHLRPKLPRDIETICLKCLDKDPARRYKSAGDLRDDLKRFLNDEPVQARRISRTARFGRWCRRRPAVASLIAALLIAIGVGGYGMTREYRRANSERITAIAERDRSLRLLAQAHNLLDKLHKVGEELRRDAKTAPKGREILQETVGYYQTLLTESGNDPIFQSEIARVAILAGVTLRDLGKLEDAISTYQTGLNALNELEKHESATKNIVERRVELMMLQGDALRNSRKFAEAKPIFENCVALAQPFVDGADRSLPLSRSYAQAKLQLGSLAKESKDYAECVDLTGEGAAILRRLSEEKPDDLDLRGDFGQAIDHLGAAQVLADRLEVAEQSINESLKLHQELWNLQPKSLRAQLAVAMAHGRLGDVALKRGLPEDAIEFNKQSAAIYDQAATSSPHIPQIHRDYSRLLICQADLYESKKRYDEAAACLEKATISRLRLVEIQPTSTRRRLDLAEALVLHARMALANKDVSAAQLSIKRARIQFNAVRPTTTIPELVQELKRLETTADQLEKHIQSQKAAPSKTPAVID